MGLTFRTMDSDRDREHFVRFRNDAAQVSFGHPEGFDVEDYTALIAERVQEFPDGYVMVEDDGELIGQIEMHPRDFEGRTIGFLSLIYLIPERRGQGLGQHLIHYIEETFQHVGVDEYHLRVSPTNPAVRFYQKNGFVKIREERHQHVMWRLAKQFKRLVAD